MFKHIDFNLLVFGISTAVFVYVIYWALTRCTWSWGSDDEDEEEPKPKKKKEPVFIDTKPMQIGKDYNIFSAKHQDEILRDKDEESDWDIFKKGKK